MGLRRGVYTIRHYVCVHAIICNFLSLNSDTTTILSS